MKITDIYIGLEKDVVIKGNTKTSEIHVNKVEKVSTSEISFHKKDIDVSGNKKIKLIKNKTKNFDSFFRDKRLKDIDLQQKISFIEKLKFRNRSKNIFENNMIINKNSLKKSGYIFIGFFLILFILKLIIGGFVNAGFNKLNSIKETGGNIESIESKLNSARFDFIVADLLFIPISIFGTDNIKNAGHVIKGGKELTTLGDNLLYFYIGLNNIIQTKGLDTIYLTNLLENNKAQFQKFEFLLANALFQFEKVTSVGNEYLDKKIVSNTKKLRSIIQLLDTLNINFHTFLNILGHDREKKYLVVFQNNDEIRPTGGFMGSVGELTLYRGKVKTFVKGDIYAYEWEINKILKNKEKAPKGLDQITGTFGLRDANYFPLVSDSSQAIKGFLDTIDTQFDGIIYINQNTILDILDLTGPIYLESIDESITRDNFSLIISTLVEAKTFKVGSLGTPKQILFDFSDILISRIIEKKDYSEYLSVLIENLKNREIIMYSFTSEENSLLWKLSVNGKMNFSESLDFSYPVYTSLSGNKSDRYMKRNYTKSITKNQDCSINTSLKIQSSHYYTSRIEQEVNGLLDKYSIQNKNHIQYIQGRGDNHQYVRVLLPKNALINNKNGLMNIIHDNDFIIAEFFLKTRRLETTEFTIDYTIPNKACKEYDYIFYKQPGLKKYDFHINTPGIQENYKSITSDFIYRK